MTWRAPVLPATEQVAIAVGNRLRLANAKFDAAAEELAWSDEHILRIVENYNLSEIGRADLRFSPAEVRKAFRLLLIDLIAELDALWEAGLMSVNEVRAATEWPESDTMPS